MGGTFMGVVLQERINDSNKHVSGGSCQLGEFLEHIYGVSSAWED